MEYYTFTPTWNTINFLFDKILSDLKNASDDTKIEKTVFLKSSEITLSIFAKRRTCQKLNYCMKKTGLIGLTKSISTTKWSTGKTKWSTSTTEWPRGMVNRFSYGVFGDMYDCRN